MEKVTSSKSTDGTKTGAAAACHEALVLWEIEIGIFHVFELPADGRRDEVEKVGRGEAEAQAVNGVEVGRDEKVNFWGEGQEIRHLVGCDSVRCDSSNFCRSCDESYRCKVNEVLMFARAPSRQGRCLVDAGKLVLLSRNIFHSNITCSEQAALRISTNDIFAPHFGIWD